MRYNLRDELVLSSGSDSKVVLLHVPSLASEPITLGDEGSEDEKVKTLVLKCLLFLKILGLLQFGFALFQKK